MILFRHGETSWSRSGRHTGRTDLSLTELGVESARSRASALADIAFALGLSSPRQRAQDTCALAGLRADMQTSGDLAEWDCGTCEGLPSAEILREVPGWNVFSDGRSSGETPEQISDRADRLIAHSLTTGGPIGLFTHGQLGCALVARWIGLPAAVGAHLALSPACAGVLGPKPGHPHVPVIEQWNTSATDLFSISRQADHVGS